MAAWGNGKGPGKRVPLNWAGFGRLSNICEKSEPPQNSKYVENGNEGKKLGEKDGKEPPGGMKSFYVIFIMARFTRLQRGEKR